MSYFAIQKNTANKCPLTEDGVPIFWPSSRPYATASQLGPKIEKSALAGPPQVDYQASLPSHGSPSALYFSPPDGRLATGNQMTGPAGNGGLQPTNNYNNAAFTFKNRYV